MTTTVLLKHDESPKELILKTNTRNTPENIINLHRLSGSINRKPLISNATSEYIADSDEEIYRDDSDNNDKDNGSYHGLKGIHSLEMEEKAKIDRYWKQLIFYIIYNSIRFLIIGIIVLMVNIKHQNDIQGFKNGNNNTVCCLCYNYAESMNPKDRMDWSMCYESCDHCNSCTNTQNTNDQCKLPESIDIIITNMIDDDCPDKLSITSFKYFVKNYIFYGVGAIISVIIYIGVMVIGSIINKAQSLIHSAVIFIFLNVVISLICAYCIIKPYQYYLDTYSFDNISFQCYKDSLNEDIENMLTFLVRCTVGFVALPFILCCCRCIAFRKDSYRIRKIYGFVMRIILILAVCGCIVATVALTWISITVARHHHNNSNNNNLLNNASTLVIAIDSFMVLSVFDICIFCPFCRNKIKTIYMVRYSPYMTQKEWELTQSDNKSMQTANTYYNDDQ